MVMTYSNQLGHHMLQSWWVGLAASHDPYFLSAGGITGVWQRIPSGPK